ncbi:Pentatricopeptide repeat-containing protein [Acorus gramineus]|uniref:Pentatricopeptide repeat-containing protein n=1 Tax=Acorus gramineus TaxID=55184 RepID=A0AAV9AB92_ACOGR|nr:Pentatricopeptide repeat-containing protein [Acorus gramineus]
MKLRTRTPTTITSSSSTNLSHPILHALESCDAASPHFDQIHAQLTLSGLLHHPFFAGRAIKKLCSSPLLVNRAVSVFARLDSPDAFICNTIIRTLIRSKDPRKALDFYNHQMLPRSIPPNHFTHPLLSKACADLRLVADGEKSHAVALKSGLASDLFVFNSLIHMYSSFGRVDSARRVFCANHEAADVVTWNSMIDAYAKNGMVSEARKAFDGMPRRDRVSWNSMIAAYAAVGDVEAAMALFTRMPERDAVSWNSVIDVHARAGEVAKARELFDRMPRRSAVSYNVVLALYVRVRDYRACLGLFEEMLNEAEPNEATLVSVLTACANSGSLERGRWVHSYIRGEEDRIRPDVLLSTTLLTMYAKCGDMGSAREVFDRMADKSVVSWNSMIMGYGVHGEGERAVEVFLEMEREGPRPNGATFVCVLCACAHAGLVVEGWWCFDRMVRVYGIEPGVDHYGCMVDLLGRAGLVEDSKALVGVMSVRPGKAFWSALVSACGEHGNCKLGERVCRRLMEVDPDDICPYVLLSNMYAAVGRWEDVEKVREMVREKGMQKNVGVSRVDLGGFGWELSLEGCEMSMPKKRIVESMFRDVETQRKVSCLQK